MFFRTALRFALRKSASLSAFTLMSLSRVMLLLVGGLLLLLAAIFFWQQYAPLQQSNTQSALLANEEPEVEATPDQKPEVQDAHTLSEEELAEKRAEILDRFARLNAREEKLQLDVTSQKEPFIVELPSQN